MKTPEPHATKQGKAVNLGKLYRYDTKDGVRYILSHWRQDRSPRGFYITREEVHARLDELLDSLEQGQHTPKVRGRSSAKWKGHAPA